VEYWLKKTFEFLREVSLIFSFMGFMGKNIYYFYEIPFWVIFFFLNINFYIFVT